MVENVWGRGHSQLVLQSNQVPWDDDKDTLKAMNQAFEIYFLGIKAAINAPGMEMYNSVRDSFTDGSGRTVADDLEEAFLYLVKRLHLNSSRTEYWWGDTQRQLYSGALIEGKVQVPKSIFEFLTSVEGKMQNLLKGYVQWADLFTEAEYQSQDRDWKKLGQTINSVSSTGGKVKHLLWLAPNRVRVRAGNAITFVGVTTSLHEAATAFADDRLTSHLKEALAVEILGKLPILGQFYGAALKSFPGIINGYTARVACRAKMIENASEGRDFRDACRETNRFY